MGSAVQFTERAPAQHHDEPHQARIHAAPQLVDLEIRAQCRLSNESDLVCLYRLGQPGTGPAPPAVTSLEGNRFAGRRGSIGIGVDTPFTVALPPAAD